MIKAPNVFGQIKGQSVTTDASLGRQSAFKVAPESFQAIDVVLARTVGSFGMVDQTVNIPLGGDPGVALPGVGVDDRPPTDMSAYQGPQRAGMYIRNHFRPNLSSSTENPEDRSFGGSTTSFRAPGALALALVLPSPTHIGLIDFDLPLKHRRNFPHHALSQQGQGTQNPLPMQVGFLSDYSTTRASYKPPQQLVPLPGGQTQGPTVWSPVISTSRTTTPIPLQYPVLTTSTSRTFQSSRHPIILPH